MSPQRLPLELIDVDGEADGIAADLDEAMQRSDVNGMRDCFSRLVRNHRRVVHILTEMCEEVRVLSGRGQ